MSKRVFFGYATKGAWIVMVAVMLQSCGFIKDKFGGKNSKGGKGGKKGAKQEVGVRNGEVIATGRKDYKQDTPYGMVLIPSGSFHDGASRRRCSCRRKLISIAV
jgi:sulfatase modifying factor 1